MGEEGECGRGIEGVGGEGECGRGIEVWDGRGVWDGMGGAITHISNRPNVQLVLYK